MPYTLLEPARQHAERAGGSREKVGESPLLKNGSLEPGSRRSLQRAATNGRPLCETL